MTQKVFLSSIYYFIPLFAPKKRYKEGLNEQIDTPFCANNYGCSIRYKSIDVKTFRFIPNSGNAAELSVNIKRYILRIPNKNGKRFKYILAVGTDIDQTLYQAKNNTNVPCDERLLVLLRQSFYCPANTMDFPKLLTDDAGQLSFLHWLKEDVLPEIEGFHRKWLQLKYSITDIRCAQIDDNETNKEDAFAKTYFNSNLYPIDYVFGSRYENFVYGLLFSCQDYNSLSHETVKDTLSPYIPEHESTRIYSTYGKIVSLHSHGSESERINFVKDHFCLSHLPNVSEICIAILIDSQLHLYLSKLNEYEQSNEIRRMILKTSQMMEHFSNQPNMFAKKVHHIHRSWGLYEKMEFIKNEGGLYAQIIDSKLSKRINYLNIFLSIYVLFISIITYIITYNSIKFGKSMDNQFCCKCGEFVSSTMQEPLLGISEKTLFSLFCVSIFTFLLILIVLSIHGIRQRDKLIALLQKWHDGE